MSSFKLNLKPAAAFANGESEQNEVDAATRRAESEEREQSTSPNKSKVALNRLSVSPRGDGTAGNNINRYADPNAGATSRAAPPPIAALRLGKVEGIAEINSETDSTPTTHRDTTRSTATMVPGLRLGNTNHLRHSSSNLSDAAGATTDSARARDSTTEVSAPQQLQRKATSVPAGAQGGTSSSSSTQPPTQVMSSIPAFSIALSKLHTNTANTSNPTGAYIATDDSPRSARYIGSHGQHGSFHQPQNYQLNRYNPEIEKPVTIDEDDDFLITIDDMPNDPKVLKTQLQDARREILSWEARFDLMRDHYQNHVAKLISHMEHEHAVHHHELAATHGVSYHNPHRHPHDNLEGTTTLSGTTTSTNNSPPGSGPGPRSRNPPFVINTVTARGTNGAYVDSAIQTDITVALLDVMIKYPQSIRGERGLTRATSPAVSNTTTKRAGSPTAKKAGTTKTTTRHSTSPAPTTSRATSVAAAHTATTARREKTPSDRKSTGSDRPPSQGTGTPMSRSLLGPSATRTSGKSNGILGGSLGNGSGLLSSKLGTAPQTSRARNSAVLSVNSYGSKPLTPRASLATSRGVSPAGPANNGSITSRASGSAPSSRTGPSGVSIPPTLSSAAYVKPGARKFAGILSGSTTPTKGGHQGGTSAFDMSGSRRNETEFAGSASFGNGISSSSAQSPMRTAPPPPTSSAALHAAANSPVKSIITRPQLQAGGSRYPAVAEHLAK